MICPPCRDAADNKRPQGHNQCTGHGRETAEADSLESLAHATSSRCDCQHRQGHWINKESK